MKKIKKRGAVYGVIALLLCAAAYLNWSYVDTPEDLLAAQQTDAQADTQTDASADSTAGEGDYFASSRLTRTQARDEAVSTLKELSESDTADQRAKDGTDFRTGGRHGGRSQYREPDSSQRLRGRSRDAR